MMSSFCTYPNPRKRQSLSFPQLTTNVVGGKTGEYDLVRKKTPPCCCCVDDEEYSAPVGTDPVTLYMEELGHKFRRIHLNKLLTRTPTDKSRLRVVVVGDVHERFTISEDTLALEILHPDLVLVAGDSVEDAKLAKLVANLDMPKALIMGSHEYSSPYPEYSEINENIQYLLDYLGVEHVGYSRLDFPKMKLSVVGGRPFSVGGEQLFPKHLLAKRYGVNNIDESAKLISKAAFGTPEDHFIILLSHNGPAGLGSNIDDICGMTWSEHGGDHGDPDLAQSISQLKETTKLSIPLVVFGHMQKDLEPGNRKMVVAGDDNTVYVNGAIVPRVKNIVDEQGIVQDGSLRAFTLIEFSENVVSKVTEVWVKLIGDQASIESEEVLLTTDETWV